MEADWSVEIGPELPVIEGTWEGFVDLRSSPSAVELIEEARKCAPLHEALVALNGAGSPVFTTKCDFWTVPGEEIDADEFSATVEAARAGFACYIDVLQRDVARLQSFEVHEQQAREIAKALHGIDVRQSRVDIVVRRASLNEGCGFGLTLYSAGCGSAQTEAIAAWQAALGAAVAATISKAQPRNMGE